MHGVCPARKQKGLLMTGDSTANLAPRIPPRLSKYPERRSSTQMLRVMKVFTGLGSVRRGLCKEGVLQCLEQT